MAGRCRRGKVAVVAGAGAGATPTGVLRMTSASFNELLRVASLLLLLLLLLLLPSFGVDCRFRSPGAVDGPPLIACAYRRRASWLGS